METMMLYLLASPATGDGSRPWIAAIILIVSVIVLISLFLLGRKSDKQDDSYRDEDDQLEE